MQRKLLNPAFNVNHMRHMIPIFHKVTRQVPFRSLYSRVSYVSQISQLRENLCLVVSNDPQEINIADWMGNLALELIGQAGLGYSFGTLEGRDDEFCRTLKEWMSV